MTSATLTVWSNLRLPDRAHAALAAGLGAHRLVRALELTEHNHPVGRPDPRLAEADVAFGQPEAEQCVACGRLLWVQLTSAGYTAFAGEDVREGLITRGVPVTSSSAVYDEPCAQHALAFLLAQARQLPRSLRGPAAQAWDRVPTRAASFLLAKQTVLLVGYGAIARRLAELLAPFGVAVLGFRRRPRGDEPIRVLPVAELDRWLPGADFVVDILPAAADTVEFFGPARFALMKPGATFVNIGRGATVDQEALAAALRGRLGAAYLDVTTPEPLPPGHPLWDQPNCFITPHVAGGHGDEYDRLVAHFLDNLGRFLGGHPLAGRVY